MFILEERNDCEHNDYQFGFFQFRDVVSYCNYNGSPVFACSLDAEGAFDGIRHPMLFMKIMNVVPDMCWRLLNNWYSNINVRIRLNNLSNKLIKICKGTRQGGLTSPFIFNVFYKDMIDNLCNHDGGISIGNTRFNIFCYTGDVLLMSTTVTGIQ